MSKRTERPSRTVACLLDIVAFGGLVDFWMELLLCPSMAVATHISLLTVSGVTPFIVQFYIRAGCGPGGGGRGGREGGREGGRVRGGREGVRKRE